MSSTNCGGPLPLGASTVTADPSLTEEETEPSAAVTYTYLFSAVLAAWG
jgi:hypothetical protein